MGVEEMVDRLRVYAKKTNARGFRKFWRFKRDIAKLQSKIESKKLYDYFGLYLHDINDMEKRLEGLHYQKEIYWK